MIRSFLVALCLVPVAALASDDFPGAGSSWFVQANLAAMRDASGDRALYEWLEREVIEDLEEEFGAGTIERFDVISLFSGGDDGKGFGIAFEGRIDAELRDRVIHRLAAEPLEGVPGERAYLAGANDEFADRLDLDIEGGSLYLAFDDDTAAFATTSRELLERFIAGERFDPAGRSGLLIIRAEPLVAGGVDTESVGDRHGRWNSKVMRNIRRAGFALSDAEGGYAIDIELVAVDEAQAEALANIVQGLISLQALSQEEPEMAFLSTLQTRREGDRMNLSLRVGSEELVTLLD